MKIPVFVSCPTLLNTGQEKSRAILLQELHFLQMEARALGRSDYPTSFPLREVHVMATHCSGGLILGFEQFHADSGQHKRGRDDEEPATDVSFPTPWNHLEAGIPFSLGLPLLVFREPHIEGGVFDRGVTDVFVHKMPEPPLSATQKQELREVFLKWQAKVREHYYKDRRLTLADH